MRLTGRVGEDGRESRKLHAFRLDHPGRSADVGWQYTYFLDSLQA